MAMIYHQVSVDETLKNLGVNANGLTTEERTNRQTEFGKNTIPQPKPKSLISIFFHQFLNPLIYVLIAAAIISFATGDLNDAIFIFAIIFINAVMGTYQEWRAENSALALQNLVKIKSRVKRNNGVHEIEAEELVPGDVVMLESGQKVPADLRLIEVSDLAME